MEAESDGEQLREQLRLHLEDKRFLNLLISFFCVYFNCFLQKKQ